MKDKKEKLEALLERLIELRKETNIYTTNLINQIKDVVREINKEPTVRIIPFDIEKAKQGAKVVTRDGHDVRILCYSSRNANSTQPIVSEIDKGEDVMLTTHAEDGTFLFNKSKSDYDLMIEEECV